MFGSLENKEQIMSQSVIIVKIWNFFVFKN
jgi:hypothetical protein